MWATCYYRYLKKIGALSAAVMFISCSHPVDPTIDLPQTDQIEGISATLYPGPDKGPHLADMNLTTDDYDHIRHLIANARPFRESPDDLNTKMGVIHLTLKNGEAISISYYWAGKPSVFLKLDGQAKVFVASDDGGRDLGMVITYYIRDRSGKK
jgi:hypothetical protein